MMFSIFLDDPISPKTVNDSSVSLEYSIFQTLSLVWIQSDDETEKLWRRIMKYLTMYILSFRLFYFINIFQASLLILGLKD